MTERRGKRVPGRTEVLVRAEMTLKFVVRRIVQTDSGGEAEAWERDGESLKVDVGESSPVALSGDLARTSLDCAERGISAFPLPDPNQALYDAACDLIPADVEEDEGTVIGMVTVAADETLESVRAKGEL